MLISWTVSIKKREVSRFSRYPDYKAELIFPNILTVFKNHRKSIIQIASEASYVYILSGQKFIKNAKNIPIVVKQCYQTGQS